MFHLPLGSWIARHRANRRWKRELRDWWRAERRRGVPLPPKGVLPEGPSDLYWYAFVPTNVVDGDTIDGVIDFGFHLRQDMRLRLYGINTPELHDADPAKRARAVAARDTVVRALPKEAKVVIRTHLDKADKYGRGLAVVYVSADGGATWTNLNDALVAAGLADPYFP